MFDNELRGLYQGLEFHDFTHRIIDIVSDDTGRDQYREIIRGHLL